MIAHRDQLGAGQHEGHGQHFGPVAIGMRRQRGGHHVSPVLAVEARGNLDFLHLLASRNAYADQLLDGSLFFLGRAEKIDPDNPVLAGGKVAHDAQAVIVSDEGFDHRRILPLPTCLDGGRGGAMLPPDSPRPMPRQP